MYRYILSVTGKPPVAQVREHEIGSTTPLSWDRIVDLVHEFYKEKYSSEELQPDSIRLVVLSFLASGSDHAKAVAAFNEYALKLIGPLPYRKDDDVEVSEL